MLARREINEVAAAVIEAVVVQMVSDHSRRRVGDEAVHTQGLFVAADLDVSVCVKRAFEKLSVPFVFADELEVGFVDESGQAPDEGDSSRIWRVCPANWLLWHL